MYDIRQFRPTLYLLVAVGFTGFGIATLAPLMWMLGMAGLALNVWLVRTGRFRPLPRLVANFGTLLAAVLTGIQAIGDPRPIFPIGNFLLVLQLIKLFEQRANRDYAQVLVLSLLLMVAAAISTASLIFGLLFLFYLLVSPYACLLFHLKVETDHAKRLMGLDERNADPMTLRQDQRYLNTSMFRMTATVAAFATVMAIATFLFFPRSSSANMLGWQLHPNAATSGISDSMNMQSVARVQQNTTQIGTVHVTRNEQTVSGGTIYLRGNVFNEYNINPASGDRWNWARASRHVSSHIDQLEAGADRSFGEVPAARGDERWVAEFNPLDPINVQFLLALGRPTSVSVGRRIQLGFAEQDQVITLGRALYAPLTYRVTSTLPLVASPPPAPSSVLTGPDDQAEGNASVDASRRPIVGVTPRVAEYARRPEVSGVDANGQPLIEQIGDPGVRPPAVAADVAANIERHLQQTFAYTLDLTDSRSKDDADDRDPIERFLYDTKKGWCEHFAGAMTLMCQSLGLQARLVSGYKCDEYNPLGEYFIIRQSHAHAWVEVLVRQGDRDVWQTYDPTSGREADAAAAAANSTSLLKRVEHVFDYLEHQWATSVIAYDSGSQTSLYDKVETRMANASTSATSAVRERGWSWSDLVDRYNGLNQFLLGSYVIASLIALIAFTGITLIAWYVIGRIRLTRRARRIGLGGLGADEARRLARQLGFYDEMIKVLEQRRIICPPHMTPLEFSRSLEFLSEEAYDSVVRLTKVFYRVRFGNNDLTPSQRRTLGRVVDRLRAVLVPDPKAR